MSAGVKASIWRKFLTGSTGAVTDRREWWGRGTDPMPWPARLEPAGEAAMPWAKRRVFPGCDDQVAHARQFVRLALNGCPVVDEAILCVSELATNTLRHTASGDGGNFKVFVQQGNSSVRVAVCDDGSYKEPAVHVFDAMSEERRGLGMVALIADRWGQAGDEYGRTVWFELTWAAVPGHDRTVPRRRYSGGARGRGPRGRRQRGAARTH